MQLLLLFALALSLPDAGPPPDPLADARALFAHRLNRGSLDAAITRCDAIDSFGGLVLDARARRFRAQAFEFRRRTRNRAAAVRDLEAARGLATRAWHQCSPGPTIAKAGAACVPALVELADADLLLAGLRRAAEAAPLLREANALTLRVEQLDPDAELGAAHRIRGEVLAALPALAGGDLLASRFEFERAIAASPDLVENRVAMAARYAVEAQDRTLFHGLLESALHLDPRAIPERTPEQLLARARALSLLHRERGG